MVPLVRKILAGALLAMSGCLFWYAACSYKVSGKDPARLGDFSARLYPEAQALNGHLDYLRLDLAGAAESYKNALFAEPSMIDAWIGLARVRIASGNKDGARRILNIIAPALRSVSTWKWHELLLAYDLHDEPYFAECYNFILSYLPHRVQEASWLGSRFWGGWSEVVPHVFTYNRPVYLSVLMDNKQVDAAVALFDVMESECPNWEEKDQLRLCDFLLSNDRLKEAKAVWRLWRKKDSPLIYDGRFERAPLNGSFGWRFRADRDVLVERAAGSPCPAGSCLHIHFKGALNISGDLASQIVPIKPQTSYSLRFLRRSNALTTDQGVFVAVDGYKEGGPNVTSQPVLENSQWKEERVDFATPAGCEAIVLHVRRNESLKMDNKISGDYWLDSVDLIQASDFRF